MNKSHIWPLAVVGLLLLSVAIQSAMIVASIHDPSFAVEPDYERKAAEWDDRARQEQVNRRLGWTLDLGTTPSPDPGHVDVTLSLFDRWGKPLREARVELATFHNARAADVFHAVLPCTEEGLCAATLPLRRSGLWEFRLRVEQGRELYTETIRKSVLSVPRAAGALPVNR